MSFAGAAAAIIVGACNAPKTLVFALQWHSCSYFVVDALSPGVYLWQRSAEIGSRISQGQQLIVVVQIDNVWTTANFKETQLKKMHVGQRVKIQVDSLDESFDGEVEYMPAATGDRSSLFPPENATGNYVKIVQRLPVRIRFNPNQRDLDRLRPGMSVEPKVHLD